MLAGWAGADRAGAEDATAAGAPAVEKYNVVWDSPSESSFGSMPLGNGDIGLNVWVEKNGHLLFYIAKLDALDSRQVGRKLGRIRLRLDPPLPLDRFRQTLSLRDASVRVEAGDVRLRVWVDAHQPIIRLEGKSQTPRTAFVTLESLRPLANATDPLPGAGTVGVLFNDKEDRLACVTVTNLPIGGPRTSEVKTPRRWSPRPRTRSCTALRVACYRAKASYARSLLSANSRRRCAWRNHRPSSTTR